LHGGGSVEDPATFILQAGPQCAACITAKENFAMNKDKAAGQWKQLKGKVKEQWGKLTDDDLMVLEGDQDQLAGRIQERYGIAKEEAERQVRDFRTRYSDLYGEPTRKRA
jgi:uncharacterized protein YjbJ (UPF0337 family)